MRCKTTTNSINFYSHGNICTDSSSVPEYYLKKNKLLLRKLSFYENERQCISKIIGCIQCDTSQTDKCINCGPGMDLIGGECVRICGRDDNRLG